MSGASRAILQQACRRHAPAQARDANHAVKSALGFADAQRFSRALLDAVDEVASTSVGDDCGEGFAPPSPWARAFALIEQ